MAVRIEPFGRLAQPIERDAVAEGQPLLVSPYPDARILGFTFVLTLLTGVIFGLMPALRASRPDPWTTLKDTIGSIAGTGASPAGVLLVCIGVAVMCAS